MNARFLLLGLGLALAAPAVAQAPEPPPADPDAALVAAQLAAHLAAARQTPALAPEDNLSALGDIRVRGLNTTLRLRAVSGVTDFRTAQGLDVCSTCQISATTGSLVFVGSQAEQRFRAGGPLTIGRMRVVKSGGRLVLDSLGVGGAGSFSFGTLDLSGSTLATPTSLAVTDALLGFGTLAFTGAATQTLTLPAGGLGTASLWLEKPSGTFALPQPVTVSGTLRNAGTATLDGDVTIGPTGTLDLASGTLTLRADLPVYGVLNAGGGTFDLGGHEIRLGATTVPITGGVEITRLGAISGDGSTLGATTDDVLHADRPHIDGEGWRMIAAPFGGLSFTQLNDDFPTQGAASTDIPSGPPILYQWVPANPPPSRYVAVGDYADPMAPGRGFLFYAYATDPATGDPALPTVWDVTGMEPSGPVQIPLSWDLVDAQRRWNLLGNPYAAPIDWHLVQAGGRFEGTYAVWDPAASAYAYYSTTGTAIGRAGRYMPAFQGFWARSTDDSPFLFTFQRAWKAPFAGGVHVGRTSAPDAVEVPPHVRLRLTGADLPAAEAVALLTDDPLANGAWLAPLTPDHASLFFADDATGDATGERLVFAARPPGAPAAFALGAEATRAGTFTLSWPDLASAPDGALVLTDTQTGARVDLRQAPSYTFTLDAPSAANAAVRAGLPSSPGDVAGASRFVLTVGGSVVVSTEGEPVPSSLVVEAPRPNPATASVSVRVGLPVAGRLEVRLYDALGRWVSTVSEGDRGAGWHEVRAEVGSLPSGVYVMRVAAAGATSVRRLTVLR